MLRTLWRGCLAIAQKVGYFQSQLILTLIYFVVLAPFAVVIRLFVDPLRLRRTLSWNWLSRDHSNASLHSVRQQF